MPGPIGRAPPVARSSANRRRALQTLMAVLTWIAWLSALAGCSEDRADPGSAAAGLAGVDPQADFENRCRRRRSARGRKTPGECRAFAQPPAGSAAGTLGPEADLPGAATLGVSNLQPRGPGAASIAGTQVVFHAVGSYQLRCQVPQFALQD